MSGLALILAGSLWSAGALTPAPPASRAGTLTLRAAIAEALAASPALEPARDALEIAQIQQRLAQSRFNVQLTPTLQAGTLANGLGHQQAGLTASRRLPTGTELSLSADWLRFHSDIHTQRDAGLSFTVTQSVLQAFGPVPREGLTVAKRASLRAARAVDEARQDLIIRAADAYFTIVRQELLSAAAAQARARAERLRASSEARARVGLATQLDVMRAELLAAEAEVSAASQQESLERARDSLNILLGRAVGSPVQVETNDVPETIGSVPPDLASLQAMALERRIDMHEARDRRADAGRAESTARWSALPDVQLTAGYTRRGLGGDGPPIFGNWLTGWRAGVNTTYGLQRDAASAAAAASAITVRAADRDLFERAQSVLAAVRAAHRAVARTAGAIDIQRKALTVAERQARLAALRHERGLADNVDVIDAEMNQLQARTALISARVDHAMARLALDRAAGLLNPDGYLK
jgi:outer membrane protein TolC